MIRVSIYHLYFITLWKTQITGWKTMNLISEDQEKQFLKIIDDEQLWYKDILKESADTYVQRINDMTAALH
jgi:hypothetical protein